MDDVQLLRQYIKDGSQDAFASIVAGHVDLVYGTARRLVGDEHVAQDVAQAVFVVLARRAKEVEPGRLAGWLVNAARLAANEARRSKLCREKHEWRAAQMRSSKRSEDVDEPTLEQLTPLLDEALCRLGEADRTAVAMRFLQGRSFAEVAAAMGSSEEAARKRVERAVEKLRGMFMKKGFAPSAGGLMVVLAAHQAQAAPAGLASSISATAISGGAGTGAILAKGAMKMMTIAKVKVAAAIVLGIAVAGGVTAAEMRSGTATQAAAVPTTVPSDMGTYAALTKRDIQTAVEAKSKSIRNFSVTFQEVAIEPAPEEVALTHMTFVVEGTKTYWVSETTNDAARPEQIGRREGAYDGQATTIRPSAFRALVFHGRENEALTSHNRYYDLMMQHAGWEDDPDAGHPNSLVSIARAETTKLRPDVEMVEGHPCRVLDAYERGRLHQSVWLDCQRGFLPVRQRFFMGSDQQLVMEHDIDQAIQIQDMWFATRGRRVTYPWKAKYPNEHAPTKVSVAKIIVDEYQPGNAAIRVNQELSETQFDLRKRLPVGTLVLETEATTRSTRDSGEHPRASSVE